MNKPYVSPSEKFLAVNEYSAVTLSTEGGNVHLRLYADGLAIYNKIKGDCSCCIADYHDCNAEYYTGGLTILQTADYSDGSLHVNKYYARPYLGLWYKNQAKTLNCEALKELIQVVPRYLGEPNGAFDSYVGDVKSLPLILTELIKHTVQLSKEVSDAVAAHREKVDGAEAKRKAQAKEAKEFYQNFLEGLNILMNASSPEEKC